MAFTRLSNELSEKSSVELDGIFVLELMPYAPESYSKVYIYGKMLASGNYPDNTPERMARMLGLTEDEVMGAFRYWEEQGLVKISAVPPYEIEYMPVRYARPSSKTYSKKKYAPFNEMLMRMLPERTFLPSELNEYYACIEDFHFEVDAMLAVIAYCVRLKGKNVHWKYIVAVARNLSIEGYRTAAEVETKLSASEILSEEVTKLFKTLKIKRAQDYDDIRLYKKWTEELGFASGTILTVANGVYGEMKGLDTLLTRYHADGLISLQDIEEYKRNRDSLLSLTKELLIKLDVRFNHLDYYAETYVKEWLKLGFDGGTLLFVADWCFHHDKKSCDKMSAVLGECFDNGATTDDDVKARLGGENKFDKEIKKLFALAGMSGDVTSRDRDSYNIWVNYWHVPANVLEDCAKKSVGEANPRVKMHLLVKAYYESMSDVATTVTSAVAKEKNDKQRELTVREALAEEKYRQALMAHPELLEAEKKLRSAIIDNGDVENAQKERDNIIKKLGLNAGDFAVTPKK